tara:strand:- start:6829 stop:8022 length:1194 start_codon:yes stop_codon:yes gene_type:complete
MSEDTGVSVIGNSLVGKRVILAVSGGIAATESVKLARELRRHGAEVFPMMTKSAEKVITPLALSWGSGIDVVTDWESEMAQLGGFDGLILAPATRNTIAKFVHGIIDSPIMMAISAASGSDIPILFVPSMHNDLFHDKVTGDLLSESVELGVDIMIDDPKEGKRKQPDQVEIVAMFCNLVNRRIARRKRVAITLGANAAQIDSIRKIVNTSSGNTGWSIAEYLHRMGHDVVCVSGITSRKPNFSLPDIRIAESPDSMLEESILVANSEKKPDYWIHAAAILDYSPEPISGKFPSNSGDWEITLKPTLKHLKELNGHTIGSKRIAFKLEVTGEEDSLISKSLDLISENELLAVVANMLDDVYGTSNSRCRIVFSDGKVSEIRDIRDLCLEIENIISTY